MHVIEYKRDAAVAYAHKWAFSRNPRYYDFEEIGGDCTNFASQCIYAGAGVANYTPVYGWFYNNTNDRTASWTGVEFLYQFLTNNNDGPGPFAEIVPLHKIMPGDIIQLKFSGSAFQHSPVVVSTGLVPTPGNILMAAHTYDADNRPLDTYSYSELRPLHIIGVRK